MSDVRYRTYVVGGGARAAGRTSGYGRIDVAARARVTIDGKAVEALVLGFPGSGGGPNLFRGWRSEPRGWPKNCGPNRIR